VEETLKSFKNNYLKVTHPIVLYMKQPIHVSNTASISSRKPTPTSSGF
jgi:hypothetical protein